MFVLRKMGHLMLFHGSQLASTIQRRPQSGSVQRAEATYMSRHPARRQHPNQLRHIYKCIQRPTVYHRHKQTPVNMLVRQTYCNLSKPFGCALLCRLQYRFTLDLSPLQDFASRFISCNPSLDPSSCSRHWVASFCGSLSQRRAHHFASGLVWRALSVARR